MKTISLSHLILFSQLLIAQKGSYLENVQQNKELPPLKFEIVDCESGNLTTTYIDLDGAALNKFITLTMKRDKPKSYKIDPEENTYSEVPETDRIRGKHVQIIPLTNETINGKYCAHAKVVEDFEDKGEHIYEVWMTKEILNYDKYANAFNFSSGLGSPGTLKLLNESGYVGLPVKTIHTWEGISSTTELINFREIACNEKSFIIPLNYALVPYELNANR